GGFEDEDGVGVGLGVQGENAVDLEVAGGGVVDAGGSGGVSQFGGQGGGRCHCCEVVVGGHDVGFGVRRGGGAGVDVARDGAGREAGDGGAGAHPEASDAPGEIGVADV